MRIPDLESSARGSLARGDRLRQKLVETLQAVHLSIAAMQCGQGVDHGADAGERCDAGDARI